MTEVIKLIVLGNPGNATVKLAEVLKRIKNMSYTEYPKGGSGLMIKRGGAILVFQSVKGHPIPVRVTRSGPVAIPEGCTHRATRGDKKETKAKAEEKDTSIFGKDGIFAQIFGVDPSSMFTNIFGASKT